MNANSATKIDEEAREWFATMQSGKVTDSERDALAAWLATNPRHRDAYTQYEEIWQTLRALASSSEGSALRRSVSDVSFGGAAAFLALWSNAIKHILNPRFAMAFAGLALAVTGWFMADFGDDSVQMINYQSGLAEIRTIHLSDGSEVTLGAKSSIRVSMDDLERRVDLVNGQAFFDVARNRQRPFLVKVDQTVIKVVGTAFDVHKSDGQVRITVAEGVVDVADESDPNTNEALVQLTAGQQVTRSSVGDFELVDEIPVSSMANWRNGRLVYQRTRLQEVVDDANRYIASNITLDKRLADLEVTAAFDADQLDSLPETLEALLPISVHRDGSGGILIAPAEIPPKR